MKRNKYIMMDLFSGCGGLSLGLEQAGFKLSTAVEIDGYAADTFEANNPRIKVLRKDIREVAIEDLLKKTKGKKVSLIAGCAPCQGFSSLTRKWKREDPRNELLMEMARIINGILPDAVTMENVPGLAKVGRDVFDRFIESIEKSGYYVNWDIVQMADYGVPQSRRRLVLTAGRGFFIPLPASTHACNPNNSSIKPWRTVKEAIGRYKMPVTLSEAKKRGGPQKYNWHVVRDLQPHTLARLEAATPGENWLNLKEELRPKCHRNGYKGFTNVYGRLSWDKPSSTITAGCTTPCKGRFGHPNMNRTTISVREAALLQSFPKNYIFKTDYMDIASKLIGNAVPPKFARALGESLMLAIERHHGALAR